MTVNLRSGDSYSGRTVNNVCTKEFLENKYDEALSETRPTTLYAENTIYYVERIQRLFEEYCALFYLDPTPILRECATAQNKHIDHLLASIEPALHYVDLSVMRQIFVFIEGPLTKEYGLENVEIEKPLLEVDDFVELIRYY